MKLGTIIINWNAYKVTHRCISEIVKWKTGQIVYVVDNASENGEAGLLKADFPSCRVIEATSNLGFAGANNLGLRQAMSDGCTHMLLLNNDAMISEKSLTILIASCINNRSVSVAGPVITDISGKKVLNAGGRDIAKFDTTHLKKVKHAFQCYSVDYVSGTVALLTADSIRQNGYLDEKYFFSGEIADFCKRITTTKNAARVVVCPQAKAHHRPDLAGTNRHGIYNYYIVRNRYLYLKKHHRWRADLYFQWIFRHLKHAWLAQFKYKDKSTCWILNGLIDGLAGRFGAHSSVSE